MTSSESPAAGAYAWDADLTAAFDILLGGKPAEDPTAEYGVYYADDSLDEFLFPSAWATPSALAEPEPRQLPFPGADEYPLSPGVWRFDLSRSLFRFDDHLLDGTGPWDVAGHKGPRPFGDDFVADIRAAATAGADQILVRGAELGPLLARHGIDLTHESSKKLNNWLTVLFRVATDGTLTDAMRAATFTERGPEHLVPFDDEGYADTAERRWEAALAAITRPELRDHLRMLCLDEQDARAAGAHYCGADRWPFTTDILDSLGARLVVGWEYGESQAGTAVVRLPDMPHAR
ncbi:hypothetical protein [Nocardia xishanensis]|uniref:hypothetical protein n=1 Tax=Nocardia xishanensis TaxID=238964 RepID=UPI00082F87E3|nr:hypothetical protein [Nocardia xishanensis]